MSKVFIIAEAGVNHNGRLDLAKKLIDSAKNIGADAVKFQTFKASNLVIKNSVKAEYQKKTTNPEESQFDMLRKLELSYEDYKELFAYAKEKEIVFLSSPFDIESTHFLIQMGMEIIKIPSGEITNFPYLKHIASYNKKIILSTGMCDLAEIEFALDILTKFGTAKENIIVLHCNTEYPTPMVDVNLNSMLTIKNAFKIDIGYSDHTQGIEIPIAAVAMGAKVIEKHFTLNKNFEGPDHKASLEPDEFRDMIKAIRNIEIAMGNGIKKPSFSEEKNKKIARKSIVSLTKISKGEVFSEKNITTKRPGTGISPLLWEQVIGRTAKKDFDIDELIDI